MYEQRRKNGTHIRGEKRRKYARSKKVGKETCRQGRGEGESEEMLGARRKMSEE